MKSHIAMFAALLLSACAASGPDFSTAPAPIPESKQSLVYIYRPDTFALGGRDAYFYVDGINISDLSRNGYTWFAAPAGKHVLTQKWPIDISITDKLDLPVNWEPGKTYYYRFTTTATTGYPGLTIHWQFGRVTQEVALEEIQTTKLQPAFGSSKLLPTSTQQ
jgi:Protein of unknown function (DUF2846)